MKAEQRSLYKDIINVNSIQYRIPVYQRNYTWEKENCMKLYEDLIYCVKTGNTHYLGNLVHTKPKENEEGINICSIIDGQQRLTTIMLLMKALEMSIEKEGDKIKEDIKEALYNKRCSDKYKVKLKDNELSMDNLELEKVLMENYDDLNYESKIAINYNFFLDKIQETIENDKIINIRKDKNGKEIKEEKNITYKNLFEGIKKFEIVEIELMSGDDPQKIFESINSTGVHLKTADLIRNFLLMGIQDPGEQIEIYKKYWLVLEKKVGIGNIENFFFDFLIMKNNNVIDYSQIYNKFKDYYREQKEKKTVFKELLEYGEYYKLIVRNDSSKYSKETNKKCAFFQILEHNTINVFLLKVCKDFSDIQKKYVKNIKDSEIDEKEIEFNKILDFFGNYALRRSIVGRSSSSLRKFYSSLYGRIFGKNKKNLKNYYKSVEAFICTLNSEDAMPKDDEFINSLKYTNLYRKRKILKYFFNLIENAKKEHVDLSNLSIEHIMPQTLSLDWKKDLKSNWDEIHSKYLNTLGNLSITGYNSEFYNERFIEKKKIYKRYIKDEEIKIRKLNKELEDPNIRQWNEKQILNRADRLIKLILPYFSYPKDIDKSIEFEKLYEYYLDDNNDIEDENLRIWGYKYRGEKYIANTYKDIYLGIIKILYNQNANILKSMAKNKFKFDNGNRIILSDNSNDISRKKEKISENIFIEVNFNRNAMLDIIKMVFEKCQQNINDFAILYAEREND